MNYLEVTVLVLPEDIPYCEHLLQCQMITGWIERDFGERRGLIFFLPYNERVSQITENIRTGIMSSVSAEVSIQRIKGEDWEKSWKLHFKPRKIGRFIIKPTWEFLSVPVGPDEIVVELDPGMAFGTGEHPTTSLCLEFLEDYVQRGDRVLDLGTGSGILSIASLLLGAEHVMAVDHDEVALDVAKENLTRLGLMNKVTLVNNEVCSIMNMNFDIAVGNLFLSEVRKLLETECPPLRDGGIFIASGILTEQKETLRKIIDNSAFLTLAWRTIDIWDAFAVKKNHRRRSPI